MNIKKCLPNLLISQQWKDLSSKEKMQFGLACKERSLSDDKMFEDDLEELMNEDAYRNDSAYFVTRMSELETESVITTYQSYVET